MSSKWAHKQKQEAKEDWLSVDAFLLLAITFVAVQSVGLFVAKTLFLQGVAQAPFTDNINDLQNSIFLFGMILLMTAVIIILLKLRKTKKLLWLVEILAVFSTSIIVFSAIFPTNDLLVLLFTATILALRYTNKNNMMYRNLASLIAIAGAGSFLGISLGLFPVLLFIIILAIYDIIAVFYTKHMVTISKEVTSSNYAFTVAFPTKKHTFELGNGDLVIPLVVSSSILVNGPFLNNGIIAGLCLGASFIGLMLSILFVAKKKIPMPALPPQTALMVIVILAALVLGL
jgi:presenilin-like A22 family membrane protease